MTCCYISFSFAYRPSRSPTRGRLGVASFHHGTKMVLCTIGPDRYSRAPSKTDPVLSEGTLAILGCRPFPRKSKRTHPGDLRCVNWLGILLGLAIFEAIVGASLTVNGMLNLSMACSSETPGSKKDKGASAAAGLASALMMDTPAPV